VRALWFVNGHEDRNDLLKFGLMRLHRRGALTFFEYPIAQAGRFGFSETVVRHRHRHTSVILLETNSQRVRCLVDSEDSFFWMSPLITEVDRYFCAGYNSEFFENKRLFTPYCWQTEDEIRFYRKRATDLISTYGAHFGKVRKFVPIAATMVSPKTAPPIAVQKWRNLKYKVMTPLVSGRYWHDQYRDYAARYAQLLELRKCMLVYDVALLDTLWGWPRHRVALHRKLAHLSKRYRIHSRLNWCAPNEMDGSLDQPLDRDDFPLETNPVVDYEHMLASSRLAIFATGFHWGWRSIMSLALLVGLPVYMDRPMLEPWFNFDDFIVFYNDIGDWSGIEKYLQSIDEPEWHRIRTLNQKAYDQVMTPECVAEYFVRMALD
jgi:hypothetical protein